MGGVLTGLRQQGGRRRRWEAVAMTAVVFVYRINTWGNSRSVCLECVFDGCVQCVCWGERKFAKRDTAEVVVVSTCRSCFQSGIVTILPSFATALQELV